MLLLHGLSSTPDELLSLHNPLKQAGCTVLPLRIEGYSFDPDPPERPASPYQQWVQALEAHIRQARQTHERVVVVGLSAGCGVALAAAMSEHHAPDALVLLSTTLKYDGWGVSSWHFMLPLALYTPIGRLWEYREQPPYGVKNERIRGWIARELTQRRISQAGKSTLGVSYLRENDRLLKWVRSHLRDVRCPRILAIHAHEDEVASPRNLELLRSGLPFNVTLTTRIVHNSYHMIAIDNDRQEVARETVGFITKNI